MGAVSRITRTELVSRAEKADVVAVGEEFVECDAQVHVHFIDGEIEPTREHPVELDRLGQRLADENCAVARRQTPGDEIG